MGMCNICGGQGNIILSVDHVPPIQNRFFPSAIGAQSFVTTAVDFAWCNVCQHISIHKEMTLDFDEFYNNSQTASSVVVNQYKAIINDIEQMVPDKAARIVEIGCGRGELLEMLRNSGYSNLKGYDPSAPYSSELISNEYWNGDAGNKADLVIVRHTLEEISNHEIFISMIAGALKRGGYLYAEITNSTHLVKIDGCFSLYPECHNIFSTLSLAKVLSKNELMMDSVTSINRGEWLGVWARKQIFQTLKSEVNPDDLSRKIRDLPKPLILWGAAGRGGNILAFLHLDLNEIEYVVDINEEKQGMYVPPFGQKVISPSMLKELNPKTILVANSKYKQEILAQVPTNCRVITLSEI